MILYIEIVIHWHNSNLFNFNIKFSTVNNNHFQDNETLNVIQYVWYVLHPTWWVPPCPLPPLNCLLISCFLDKILFHITGSSYLSPLYSFFITSVVVFKKMNVCENLKRDQSRLKETHNFEACNTRSHPITPPFTYPYPTSTQKKRWP